eukprot:gnl/Chilomastix_cuspidata/332.p1 GENE.gnl/Chilomastix_cuspidata/332~~gnl/Chilomastix_cuspidata/332.p1  ORF type:complete len:556 (-),score=141.87 gnl/Chilomastix_cuspidata/332:1535-3202(-)
MPPATHAPHPAAHADPPTRDGAPSEPTAASEALLCDGTLLRHRRRRCQRAACAVRAVGGTLLRAEMQCNDGIAESVITAATAVALSLAPFFPFRGAVLAAQPPLWAATLYVYRALAARWVAPFFVAQFLASAGAARNFLSSALGSYALGFVAQLPFFFFAGGLGPMLDRVVHRYAPLPPLARAYLCPLLVLAAHALLAILSPYGVAGSPQNAFMYNWAAVWPLLRVGGLPLANYCMLVPCTLAVLFAEQLVAGLRGPATRTGRHMYMWVGAWLLMLLVGGSFYSASLRNSDGSVSGYFSLIGVIGKEKELDSYDITRTACEIEPAPAFVLQRESMFTVDEDEADAELLRYSALAADNGVWLGVCGNVCASYDECYNQLWLFDSEGVQQMLYTKIKPAVGLENIIPGDEKPTVIESPFGKICAVICNDAAFPSVVAECGRRGADILLSPSWDPPTISDLETPSLIARAPENGMLMLRLVYDGRTMAVDGVGTVIADYSAVEDDLAWTGGLIHMTLPMGTGSFSIYAWLSGWLEWACVAGAAGLVTLAVAKACRGRT